MDETQILAKLDHLSDQLAELTRAHRTLCAGIARRNQLIDQLIQDQQQADEWWRNGEEPPI